MNLPNQKVIDRVRKLLALAADGGATEGEAAVAAEMARRTMEEHGIAMATVEASGGQGERRADDQMQGNAMEWWQQSLMKAIAETCFVHCELIKKLDRAGRPLGAGYRLIGRESACATARILFEYLSQTVRRVTKEQNPSVRKLFQRGMAERLCERIHDRHIEAMAEQRKSAERERDARSTGASTGSSLIVVVEDYAQKEADLNSDLRRGVAPGTTARERGEMEARWAERDAKDKERRKYLVGFAIDLMCFLGLSAEVAGYVAQGLSVERAEELLRERAPKPRTERQRQQDSEREYRQQERWRQKQARRDAERASPDFRAGRRVAETVSLDRQVDDRVVRNKLS